MTIKCKATILRLAEQPGSGSSDYSLEMQPFALSQLYLDFDSRHSPSW